MFAPTSWRFALVPQGIHMPFLLSPPTKNGLKFARSCTAATWEWSKSAELSRTHNLELSKALGIAEEFYMSISCDMSCHIKLSTKYLMGFLQPTTFQHKNDTFKISDSYNHCTKTGYTYSIIGGARPTKIYKDSDAQKACCPSTSISMTRFCKTIFCSNVASFEHTSKSKTWDFEYCSMSRKWQGVPLQHLQLLELCLKSFQIIILN